MRAPASTSTRSPGRRRAATAASAIRIGSLTGFGGTRREAAVAAPRGTGKACGGGGSWAAADAASAAAAAARPAARVRRLRRITRRKGRLPPRRPTLIGGNNGTSQRGGVYGSGAEGAGADGGPSDRAEAPRDGEGRGDGKETDVDVDKRNTARRGQGRPFQPTCPPSRISRPHSGGLVDNRDAVENQIHRANERAFGIPLPWIRAAITVVRSLDPARPAGSHTDNRGRRCPEARGPHRKGRSASGPRSLRRPPGPLRAKRHHRCPRRRRDR